MTPYSISILGAAGFVGSNLVEHYSTRGWRVVAVDRPEPAKQKRLEERFPCDRYPNVRKVAADLLTPGGLLEFSRETAGARCSLILNFAGVTLSDERIYDRVENLAGNGLLPVLVASIATGFGIRHAFASSIIVPFVGGLSASGGSGANRAIAEHDPLPKFLPRTDGGEWVARIGRRFLDYARSSLSGSCIATPRAFVDAVLRDDPIPGDVIHGDEFVDDQGKLYGLAKYIAELCTTALSRTSPTRHMAFRFPSIVGRFDLSRHVLPTIMEGLTRPNGTVEVWANNYRSFLSVGDFARVLDVVVADEDYAFDLLNVAPPGPGTSVDDLAALVKEIGRELTGRPLPGESRLVRGPLKRKYCLDTTRLMREVLSRDFAFTPLKETLKEIMRSDRPL